MADPVVREAVDRLAAEINEWAQENIVGTVSTEWLRADVPFEIRRRL